MDDSKEIGHDEDLKCVSSVESHHPRGNLDGMAAVNLRGTSLLELIGSY